MYKLEISGEQASTVTTALDIYSRLLCGQIGELDVLFRDKIMRGEVHWETLRRGMYQVKELVFPDLHPYAAYGIYSDEAPEESKIAYDLFQVIQYCTSWAKNPKGGIGVNFYAPDKCAKHNLAKMEGSESG